MCDPIDQYQCKEGVCIGIEKVCDGQADCLYEDDEFDCTNGKFLMFYFGLTTVLPIRQNLEILL